MSKKRPKPMPTEEDKKKARLKAASADPLVWAMKSVDNDFPDSREKDAETIKAENEAEMKMGPAVKEPENVESDENMLDSIDDDLADAKPTTSKNVESKPAEIKAEGKTAMPMDDGVMTVEVQPMRQNMDGVSEEEMKEKKAMRHAEISEDEPIDNDGKKVVKIASKLENQDTRKTQVKLTALESKQKKMMIGFIALLILAIGGVTFGIVAMVNQNRTTSELSEQIANSGNNGGDGQVDDEYMYVKDWGLKIKIADDLTSVSYDTDVDDYAELLVWGARKDSGSRYVPDFAKQSKNDNAMGIMVRVPRYERTSAGRLIWYDDYYNYYYKGPNGEPAVNEDEMSWWVESYLLIKEMLTNADNYARIDDTTVGQQNN